MKPFPGTFPLLAGSLALILAISTSSSALTVHLTGGFTHQRFTVTYNDGTYDSLDASATVDLTFTPSAPTCNSSNFTSTTAQVSGTIHVWGNATYFDPNPDPSIDFDNTYNYSGGPLSVPIAYEGQTGNGNVQDLVWQIATTRSHDNALPYRIHYYGSGNLLRLWISLPYPFWYSTDEEYYDTSGTVTASGQSSVSSCLDGKVYDGTTGQPITAAQVSFGGVPSTTDSSGHFFYGGIPANPYQLIVSKANYFSYTNLVNIPAFTIVQTDIFMNSQLTVFDANPRFLGSVFLTGSSFPLDPADPKTPAAMNALAAAFTVRRGLVADGSTRLLLRFQGDIPGSVTFTHTNPSAGTLSQITSSGLPINITTTFLNRKHVAFALFNAPDDITTTTVSDLLQAAFAPSVGQPATNSTPITVERAPVLLVHGLWSDLTVWGALAPQVEASGSATWRVNYYPHKGLKAAGPFVTYSGFITEGATNLLAYERYVRGYAATRVDVVAHSMGGILTRIDANDPLGKRADNYYQGYFRRLITIDTPHWGSRAATVLLDLAAANHFFRDRFYAAGHPIDQGGVADLDPRSFAQSITPRSSSERLAQTHVLAHAISCTAALQSDLSSHDEFGLYFVTKLCSFWMPAATQNMIFCNQNIALSDAEIVVANKVFTTSITMQHDGIVPVASQEGACSAVSPFLHLTHTGAPKDPSVINQVVSLLQGDLTRFGANGFPAVTTANLDPQLCPPGYSGASLAIPASLVQLSLAPSLLSVRPGSSVSLSVQAQPGAVADDVLINVAQNGSTIGDWASTNLPFQFSFTVPTNKLGFMTIVALAANASGQTDLQQTNLVVQVGPGTNIQSFAVSPNVFVFAGIGQVSQLAVSGTFSDGIMYDITGPGSGVQYTSSAPAVVSVDTNGLLTTLSQGTGTVSLAYGNLKTNLPFTVALQHPAVLSTSPWTASPGATNLPITLVGSALGGATKVEFFRNGVVDPSLSSTNLSIGAAGVNIAAAVSVNSNALPGLRTVAVTTPGGRSSIISAQGNRFFVGPPLQIDEFQASQTGSNSQIHLHIVGSPDASCILQSSTNLSRWDAVATNTLLGGDWFYDRFIADQKCLFYRATFLP